MSKTAVQNMKSPRIVVYNAEGEQVFEYTHSAPAYDADFCAKMKAALGKSPLAWTPEDVALLTKAENVTTYKSMLEPSLFTAFYEAVAAIKERLGIPATSSPVRTQAASGDAPRVKTPGQKYIFTIRNAGGEVIYTGSNAAEVNRRCLGVDKLTESQGANTETVIARAKARFGDKFSFIQA